MNPKRQRNPQMPSTRAVLRNAFSILALAATIAASPSAYAAGNDKVVSITISDKDGQPIPGSKELWMRYKYDYPAKPLLISIKLDNFGKVSEKHLDDLKTVAELGKPKTEQEKASYPGAPSKKFQELIQKKTREGSQ